MKPDPGRLQPLEPGWIGRDRTALIRFAAPQTRGMDANEQQPGSRDQQNRSTSDLQDRGESDLQDRGENDPRNRPTSGSAIDPRSLPVTQRISLLVRALNGAKRTNEALASCRDGEEMLDVLLNASSKLGLGLSREQLASTPPIRDWVWWKNKEALLTIGDNKPRYQQDGGQGRNKDGEPARRRFLGLF